jgi:hypothetical protein
MVLNVIENEAHLVTRCGIGFNDMYCHPKPFELANAFFGGSAGWPPAA